MISDDRLTKAMTFLAETDEEAADLRANMEKMEHKAKAVKDTVFKHLQGTVADRQAAAGCSDEYGAAMNEYFDALRMYEYVRNKRQTEAIVIDVYRTQAANRRVSA